MDPISQKIKRDQWRQIVMEANNSGGLKSEYLREHNISEPQFYYWQRLFRHEESSTALMPGASDPVKETAPASSETVSKAAYLELPIPEPQAAPVPAASQETSPEPAWSMKLQYKGCCIYLGKSVSEKNLTAVFRAVSNA